MIARWLSTTYQDGGREFPLVDCWGLVRVARADLGYPELPAWGAIAATDKRGMTKAYGASVGDWEQVPAQHGAIAFCFRGSLCIHVGIVVAVDGRLAVVDTNSSTGPRWMWLTDFERNFSRVVYYS